MKWNKQYRKQYMKQYYLDNKEKMDKQRKLNRLKNIEKIKKYMKQYYLDHKEKLKTYGQKHAQKYYEKNKEKLKTYAQKYYEKNKEKVKKITREYRLKNKKRYAELARIWQKKKLKTDPNFKLRKNLRKRIWQELRQKNKIYSTFKLVGCSVEELWDHLEKKFKPGMTRDNYGLWHVDHIKPCISFDLTKPKQQKICFHYTNLQPLWAAENLSKGAKYEME